METWTERWRRTDGKHEEQPAFGEPAPECVAGVASRDNHNGNARGGRPNYYMWRRAQGVCFPHPMHLIRTPSNFISFEVFSMLFKDRDFYGWKRSFGSWKTSRQDPGPHPRGPSARPV